MGGKVNRDSLVDAVPEKLRELLSQWAKDHVASVEAGANAARMQCEQLRKERDDAVMTASFLSDLRDAAVQWHKDNYSPRLRNAIDVFLRQEVARR